MIDHGGATRRSPGVLPERRPPRSAGVSPASNEQQHKCALHALDFGFPAGMTRSILTAASPGHRENTPKTRKKDRICRMGNAERAVRSTSWELYFDVHASLCPSYRLASWREGILFRCDKGNGIDSPRLDACPLSSTRHSFWPPEAGQAQRSPPSSVAVPGCLRAGALSDNALVVTSRSWMRY